MSSEELFTIEVKRTFGYTVEEVFDAWTNPEKILKWWAPEGFSQTNIHNDLKVGGDLCFAFNVMDGKRLHAIGGYSEVYAPHRLVYSWSWQELDGWQGHISTITMEFVMVDGGTEVTLTHSDLPSKELADEHERGWGKCFDRMANILG